MQFVYFIMHLVCFCTTVGRFERTIGLLPYALDLFHHETARPIISTGNDCFLAELVCITLRAVGVFLHTAVFLYTHWVYLSAKCVYFDEGRAYFSTQPYKSLI